MKTLIALLKYAGMAILSITVFAVILGIGYILIDFSMNCHFNSGGLPARKFAVIYFKGLRRTIRRHAEHLFRTGHKKI